MSREEQKQQELELLQQGQKESQIKFESTSAEREARQEKVCSFHVTCMDERDRFAPDATGEPFGSMNLFASPGGCITQDRDATNGAKKFLEIYGDEIRDANANGKKIIIDLMPHTCFKDNHAGCAAFGGDEEAEYAYFTALKDALLKLPELEKAEIRTTMYDTDTHDLIGFAGFEVDEKSHEVSAKIRRDEGEASNEYEDEWDRFHSGYRVYVGSLPHAWCPNRNLAYHLHEKMDYEELLEGIALAAKIILTHSHVPIEEKPIVIQIDRLFGYDPAIQLEDDELLARLNKSPLLKDAGIELKDEDVLIVRTQTDPDSWQGEII